MSTCDDIAEAVVLQTADDGTADQTAVACHIYFGIFVHGLLFFVLFGDIVHIVGHHNMDKFLERGFGGVPAQFLFGFGWVA